MQGLEEGDGVIGAGQGCHVALHLPGPEGETPVGQHRSGCPADVGCGSLLRPEGQVGVPFQRREPVAGRR